MKRVYISGPITKGDIGHNVRQADAAMLALMRAGLSPFNPMLSCYAGGEGGEFVGVVPNAKAHGGFRDLGHAAWVAMDFAWVEVSAAVLRLPGESTGADAECAHARSVGVPVFESLPALVAWANYDRKFEDAPLFYPVRFAP